ncbi:hypothetical protein N9Y89_00790 [bacterium]|nr:hypothetical protein [bacterium]
MKDRSLSITFSILFLLNPSIVNADNASSLTWWGENKRSIFGVDFLHKEKIGNLDLVLGVDTLNPTQ